MFLLVISCNFFSIDPICNITGLNRAALLERRKFRPPIKIFFTIFTFDRRALVGLVNRFKLFIQCIRLFCHSKRVRHVWVVFARRAITRVPLFSRGGSVVVDSFPEVRRSSSCIFFSSSRLLFLSRCSPPPDVFPVTNS